MEETNNTPMPTPAESVPNMPLTEGKSSPAKGAPNALLIALILFGLAVTGVAGYYAGRQSAQNQNPMVTPTPTPIMTESPTPTETPTTTMTVTPTATVTATATPTVVKVTKTAKIKEFGGDYTLKFTLEVPQDVTVTEGKVSSWNGIVLKKGTKSFMAFNLPYELYELLTYTTKTSVSSTIPNLSRVRAKYVFANSGSYNFAVTYATASSLFTGTGCTDSMGSSEKSKSPCVLPAVTINDEIGFSAYCSIDAQYIAICDDVMKTLKVVKE